MNSDLKTPQKGDFGYANGDDDNYYQSILVVPQLTSSIVK
jgi:hypothetical protein